MAQSPSSPETQYEVIRDKRPTPADGYPQRIEIWDALQDCVIANRGQLLCALQGRNHKRPKGAEVNDKYVGIELTDMCKRGFIRRVYK